MSQIGITIFFFFVVGVIALAMIVHGYIDKRRIRQNFEHLAGDLSGEVIQQSRFFYPRFSGEIEGRQIDLFFEVVKVGRKEILYYVYSLKAEIHCSLLLLKADAYKKMNTAPEVLQAAGPPLAEIREGYEVRANNKEAADAIFEGAAIKERLPALDEFSSLQLGPDALVVGKPYDSLSDTTSVNIMKNVRSLLKLAKAMEQCEIAA
ncbi:MAG: hypothetical protein ACE5F7_02965 [Nitrospiria bacterium]